MHTRTPAPVELAERPLARDALGPVGGKRDPVDRILGEAPRRERGLARVPAVSCDVLHGSGLYGARPAESQPVSFRRDAPDLVEEPAVGLVALGRQRPLEVRDERRAEREVRLGPRDDLVERTASGWAAPAPPAPSRGCGAQDSEEHSETLFVVEARHLLPRPGRPPDFFLRARRAVSRGSGRCGSRSSRTGSRARRRWSCSSGRA